MKANKKPLNFYLVMSIVCMLMAILVVVTARQQAMGGIGSQRVLAVILTLTSLAFLTRLVPPGEK